MANDAPFGQCPKCLIELGLGQFSQPDRPSISANHKFGDYELLKQIGRGGMGVVYKARQVSLNRTVALKMVLDAHLTSPVVLRRFLIEAETAARLDHPNIVPIYEVSETDGHHFFSMKLIEGESLEKKIRKKDFEIAKAKTSFKAGLDKIQVRIAELMATVARAVHYAHQHGVVHRDLKPSNILIDPSGQPHLTDFGVAKVLGDQQGLTQTGATIGTPGYMAPEQASGGESTVASDIYGLGAILYALLVGRPPFDGHTPFETLRKTIEETPAHPKQTNKAIDAELATICLKCLEKDSAQRYASAEALAVDLEHWLRHEPIRARRAGPIVRVQRWTLRNPVGAALIVTLFLALTGALVLLGMVRQAREAAERGQNALLVDLDMQRFWTSDEQSEKISSEKLAAIEGRRPATGRVPAKRYRMGFLVEDVPSVKVAKFAPIVGDLENDLSRRLGPVRLDLWIYKRNKEAIDDLVRGRLDFLRIGGISYLQAKSSSPGLKAIAAQAPPKWGIIFARSDLPISSLSDLKGHSFAVGESFATISFWAKYFLCQEGIGVAQLKAYEEIDAVSAFEEAVRAGKEVDLGPGNRLNSHTEVVKAVAVDRRIEAGVASEGQLRELLFSKKVTELKRFQSTSLFWLAREGLPTNVVGEMKSGLIEFRNSTLLQGFGGLGTRFVPVREEELMALEAATRMVEPCFPPPVPALPSSGAKVETE